MRKVSVLAALLLLAPTVAFSEAKNLQAMLVERGVISKGEAGDSRGGPSKVYWNGGTRVDFPDNGFTFGINTLLRTRYTFTDNDEDAVGPNTSSFDVTDARIIVSGTALHEEFSYKLEGDFVGTSDGEGTKSPHLKDAFIAWNACDWASVKMGQFKTGISRQFNTSEQYLQFADRSEVSDFYSLGRSQGIAGKTDIADGMVTLGAGLFNGTDGLSDGEGINRSGVDTKHLGVVNARFNAMGKMNANVEGDIEGTEDPALSFGLAYSVGQGNISVAADEDRSVLEAATLHTGNVDVVFKYDGWSAAAEYFWGRADLDDVDDVDVESNGGYAQVGYFIAPKEWELAVRYGFIDCDDGKAGGVCSGFDKVNEVTAGINYFWWAHHLKAQFNYSLLNQDELGGDENVNTNRWLLQVSAYL